MEQSVNTFSKGLQLDTSPMVLGNDTLSDALNATFVTMSGNEVILQNDMGNRKVDNAYLPNGYEPVGIKEYGGIIYIAAYNPITNRSLIGSFPSPERRISLADDENLGGTLNLGIGDNFIFKEEIDTNLGGLHVLKNDTALIPLTKDTSLHAGDKFIIYSVTNNNNSDSVFTNRDDITNYNNIITEDEDDEGLKQHIGKIISPKNRQYTLSLGILNSQNEFVDITNSLVRWKDDGTLIDTSNMTELLKFNSGYFIRNSNSDPWESLTVKDGILKGERENAYLVMEANTYAYKLVGPLYLLAKLNHILDFSYNIYGTFYKSGTYIVEEGLLPLPTSVLELYIEGYITYNCPDGLSNSGTGDDTYYKYDDNGTPSFDGFDFIESHPRLSSDLIYGTPEVEYDPITNLYSVKIVKKILIPNINRNDNLNYIIGVRAVNNQVNRNYIYLSGLSDKGTINVSKLGSGKISLKGWRFHNNYEKKKGTITLNLEAYPKYEKPFENLTIEFKNVLNDQGNWENTITHTIPVRNGKTNIDINWNPLEDIEGNDFLNRALYKVTIKYDNTTISDSEFYLTTELFNECYIPGNPKFVADFGDTTNSYIQEKLNIEYDVEYEILDESKLLDPVIDSQILVNNSNGNYPHIKYKNIKEINVNFKENIKYNEKLYPSFVKINDSFSMSSSFNDISIPSNNSFVNYTGTANNINYSLDNISHNNNNPITSSGNVLHISDTINYYDLFKSERNASRLIKNCYVKIDDSVIEHLIPNNQYYCGVTLDFDDRSEHDKALRSTIVEQNNLYGRNQYLPHSGKYPYNRNTAAQGNLPGQIEIKHEHHTGIQDFLFSETLIGNLVLNNFNGISNNVIFTWLFGFSTSDGNLLHSPNELSLYVLSATLTEVRYNVANRNDRISNSNNSNQKARLWWRTSDNSWALFDEPLTYPTSSSSIVGQIALNFKSGNNCDLYFCHYKEASLADVGGSKALPSTDLSDYKYNNSYSFNVTYNFSITTNNEFISTNDDVLEFSCTHKTKLLSYNILLYSSEDFQNDVRNVISSDFSNMALDLGKTKDKDKNPLLPNRIYRKTLNNELELLSNINIYVDSEYPSDKYRSILYKGNEYATAKYAYDMSTDNGGNDENLVRLKFDSVNIVRNIQ